jgi:hypothetical protein
MVYDASGQLLPIYTGIAAAIKFYGRASRKRERERERERERGRGREGERGRRLFRTR